jgi:hypothetical protein
MSNTLIQIRVDDREKRFYKWFADRYDLTLSKLFLDAVYMQILEFIAKEDDKIASENLNHLLRNMVTGNDDLPF